MKDKDSRFKDLTASESDAKIEEIAELENIENIDISPKQWIQLVENLDRYETGEKTRKKITIDKGLLKVFQLLIKAKEGRLNRYFSHHNQRANKVYIDHMKYELQSETKLREKVKELEQKNQQLKEELEKQQKQDDKIYIEKYIKDKGQIKRLPNGLSTEKKAQIIAKFLHKYLDQKEFTKYDIEGVIEQAAGENSTVKVSRILQIMLSDYPYRDEDTKDGGVKLVLDQGSIEKEKASVNGEKEP